ncbi:uncharacterized protein LOC144158322 [Haemaphysalis longicornis]
MRLLAPCFILFFATVVYCKNWRENEDRECCPCQDSEAPSKKDTPPDNESEKPAGRGGGGGSGSEEEEGGEGGRVRRSGGQRRGRGGGSEEEDGRRRGGKRRGGGGEGGGEGEGSRGVGYEYREGVIRGIEPKDFNGDFTPAMRRLQREIVNRHNKWRRLHGVPPVRNSEKLSRYAQAYAFWLAKQGEVKHRTEHKYGENIYLAWNRRPNFHIKGERAVDSWYKEIKMYKWTNKFQYECGHFTQLVWRTARKIGSGIAKHNGKIYVVTNYDPPGNVAGHFMENVPRPGGGGDEDEGGKGPAWGGQRGAGEDEGGKGPAWGGQRGGGEDEGGKGPAWGGQGGGGEGGSGRKDDYMLRRGVIRGDEPDDFNGEFTPAMRRLQRQVLRRHNKWRQLHGVPPLKHSEKLCRYAQAYAFRLAQKGVMEHRKRRKYGENLYYEWNTKPDFHVHGKAAVDAWYDEIKLHKWRNYFQKASGHFTQVVWKGSRYLGSGIAKHNGKIFIVSNYDPQGNIQGRFWKNVPRPQS